MTRHGLAPTRSSAHPRLEADPLAPTLPSVVISFNSSGIYLGQALGAALGGILVDHGITARALCLTGVAVALAAAAVHAVISRPAPGS